MHPMFLVAHAGLVERGLAERVKGEVHPRTFRRSLQIKKSSSTSAVVVRVLIRGTHVVLGGKCPGWPYLKQIGGSSYSLWFCAGW